MEMAMGKKQYTKYETRRTARPRSERLKALGAAGTVATGSSLGGVSALRSALDAHIVNAAVHVTASEREVWNLVASLFGIDDDGNVYVKGGRGFYGNSFVSSRGSDPEADGGASGVDMDTVWAALAAGTSELINASHIPELSISKVTGLQDALDAKLEGITKGMVEAELTGTITSHNHDGRYAPLSGGLIPSQYLPSYVDDVLEYASMTAFPATGEAGKIYVALDTNLTYRWGGSSYVEISPSLALGYTSSTAYPGDEGAALAALVEGMKEITDLFGIDEGGNVYVKGGKGFYGTSFVSSRGSDPEAGQGGTGLDEDAMWDALQDGGTEKIAANHLPALSSLSGQLTNAQLAYDSIAVAGVTVALGGSVTTKQIADALTSAGYKLTDTVTTLASLGITATAAEINKLDGLATTATELGYVHGVTSNIQTQLNGKQATITGAATSIVSSNLTANRALVSSSGGKVAVSAVSATELGYLDGVTSNIQAQLNGKANTSALSAYLPLAGGTMTGNLTAPALTYSRKYQTRCDSVGWYRCFSFTANNAACPTAILHISRIYNTSNGESYVFAISLGYDGKVSITQLSGTAGERIITKIRVAYVNLSTAYVDFYYSRSYSTGNEVYVSSSGYGVSQAPAQVNDTTSSFYEFETADGCKSDGGFAGTLSGNASSATKLATARSLWGKPFDGSGNVSGDMTGVGSITMTGHLLMKAATGRFVFNSAGSGFMMSMENGNFQLIRHNNASYVARLVEVDMSGNVGIKAAPASGYALTVAGAGYFSGLLTADGGLTTPQYVQVGAARLKWDAAANALYVEKSDGTACGFYSKGFVSARGSDPLADGAGGGGLDEETLWDILGTSGTEKIDESHLPTATASTPGIVKGGYAYKVPGSQTSVNLPVTITASGQMYVSVPASAIKTILMNLG